MEFGILSGLAQSGQYDQKINDLRVREQEDNRAKQMAEARARMLADDVSYQNAVNEFDAPLIKNFANEQIKKIGKYYRENPDVMYNPDKLVTLNAMKRELKDNQLLHKGLASDAAYREYVKDLQEVAKNPNAHDSEAYQDIQRQWDNYRKFGNQYGEEAAKTQGQRSFLYQKPRDFIDLIPALQKMGNSTKNYDTVKGNAPGEFYTKMRQADLNALTDAALQQNGRQIGVEARKLGLTTDRQVYDWVKNQIESGFDKQHNLGDPLAIRRLALQEAEFALSKRKFAHELDKENGPQYSTWDDLTKANAAKIPAKTAYNIWGGNQKIVVNADNGTKADLTGLGEFVPDGVMYRPKAGPLKGVPHITGYVNIPIQEAKDKGLVKNTSWWGEDDDEWKSAPGFGKKVEVIRGEKNGKPYVYAKVLHELPIDVKDATAKSMYEGETMATKHRIAPQEGYGENRAPAGSVVDQAGNVFDASGKYLGKASDFN